MRFDSQPILLASTSPRRRELITLFGLPFQSISADIDETPHSHEAPMDLVHRLSRAKAETGMRNADYQHPLVVGADTVVALDDMILGKPQDSGDASRMLKLLRNRAHIVYSGISVGDGARLLTQIATTTVWMRDYTDEEIEKYVATGDPLDKAAAYAIQNGEFKPVARIEGCHANVMGLPLCHLYNALKAFGLPVTAPDRVCQDYLKISCPVAQEILSHPMQWPVNSTSLDRP